MAQKPTLKLNGKSDVMTLFIHGIMGGPNQFSALSDAVWQKGSSYAAILLPGHGGTGKDFNKSLLHHWEDHLQSEIDKYKSDYKLLLCGHSMGGLLSLNASLERKNNIFGAAVISSPLKIKPPLMQLKVFDGVRRGRSDDPIVRAYSNCNSVEIAGTLEYLLCLKPLGELHRLIKKTRANLDKVEIPVTLIYSKHDELVSFKSAKMMSDGLGKSVKELIILEKSMHAYFPAEEESIIMTAVCDFLTKSAVLQ